MIIGILITAWSALFFLGVTFLALGEILGKQKLVEIFYYIFCVWVVLTFVGSFGTVFYLFWSCR